MPQTEPVHWRPEGWQLLACGAPHYYPARGDGPICCRVNITEVSCPNCLRIFGVAMRSNGSEMFPGPADAAGNGPAPSTSAAAEADTSESAPSAGAPGTADPDEKRALHAALAAHLATAGIELRLGGRRPGLYVDGERIR